MALPGELTLDDFRGFLPAPGAADDKYSRGVLGLVAGSLDYPGAAVLVTEAALRSGVAMARIIAPEPVRSLVLATRPEAVGVPGRIDALVVGSGMAIGDEIASRIGSCQIPDSAPKVIDAGALGYAGDIVGPRILTPHHGEMTELARSLHLPGDNPAEWAAALAQLWEVVVLLKSHRPEVYTSQGLAHRLHEGSHWLASAGTGDVLAGLLGALVTLRHPSQWSIEELATCSAAAVLVHQDAAARVSRRLGQGRPGPVLALELAIELSGVVAHLVD